MKQKTLGEAIRGHRDAADISLREFARKIGKSAPFLSDVELGRRYPSDEVLKSIAQELGVDFDELKALDHRGSLDDIKKMMRDDSMAGLAFRTAADRMMSGDLSAEEFLKKLTEER